MQARASIRHYPPWLSARYRSCGGRFLSRGRGRLYERLVLARVISRGVRWGS